MEFQVTFRVCRICLIKKNEFECMDMNAGELSPKAKLKQCIPEMNLDVDENPTVCEDCYSDLMNAYTFRCKCLETETRLNEYLMNLDAVKIDLLHEYDELKLMKEDSDDIKNDIKADIGEMEVTCAEYEEEEEVKSFDGDSYRCNICGNTYKVKSVLIKHLYSHIECPEDIEGAENFVRCSDCNLNFNKIADMKKHLRDTHAIKTKELSSASENPKRVPTISTIKPDFYLCSVCGLKYSKKNQLRMHMRKHDPNLPYKCHMCPAQFRHTSSLKVHRRVHATDINDEYLDSIFRCDICSQHFYNKGYLHKHMKIHGEKNLSCPDCNKQFNNKGDLGKHRRIHTGEKPYECKFCGMRFRVSASLIRHTRAHTGEKPYVCETCGKCFNQKYNLNSHMKMHLGLKPYVCDTCSKAFSHKSTLDVHILKLHSDGKKYKCETCYKCFSNDENLTLHLETHQSEQTNINKPEMI